MVYAHWQPVPGLDAWLAWLPDVPDKEWETLYRAMDLPRKARCDRYRRDKNRRQCILADALARHALSAATGLAPDAITFARSDRGKPYAPGLNVHFSLSHSADLVLCAVAPYPVGADVQRHRAVSDTLLRRAMGADCPGAGPENFFPWWTAREAAGKRTGQGLTLAPLQSGLSFWHQTLCRDGDRYHLCLCAREEDLPSS